MLLKDKNRVIVRVWTSKNNKDFPGNNVGHVSVETPDDYMSLWPINFTDEQIEKYQESNDLEKKYLKYFMKRKADWKSNYDEDKDAEGNPPQLTVCLYSLDCYKIKDKFNRLKDNTEGWRLIGSNLFAQSVKEIVQKVVQNPKFFGEKKEIRAIENCASLGLKLLKKGGIKDLISFNENSTISLKTSSVVEPDDLVKILIPAKLKELEKNPETKKFSFKGETPVEQLQEFSEKKSGCCLVM